MLGGDFDIGEQFHNYLLHHSMRGFCGVELPMDLVATLQEEEAGPSVARFMRWARLVFGWQSSPYFALRMHSRAIEICHGDPTDESNPFACS
jgi:hypothetical protein